MFFMIGFIFNFNP